MRLWGIFLLVVAFLASPFSAAAQVQQSGSVTPGHAPVWLTNNVVGDAGTSLNGNFSSLGVLNSGSCGFGDVSAPTSGPYYLTCLGNGGLNFGAFGGASTLPFSFTVNGINAITINANGSVSFANAPSIIFPSNSIPESSLVNIPAKAILGNATGSTGPVTSNYVASSTNSTIPTVQGAVVQNDAACWADGNGTLRDCGSSPGGTVTSVATGTGLTGGPITTSGTISVTGVLNDIATISQAQGDIYYYNGSHIVALSPGTSGQVLETQGASANPQWASAAAGGTVTSVATNNGLTGGPITASGTIGLASVTTGTVMGNSSGSSNPPTAQTVSTGLSLSGGNLAVANTAVTAGSYTNPNITVNAQGQITAASNGSTASSGVGSFSGLKIINDGSSPNTVIDMTASSVGMVNGSNGVVVDASFSCNINYATNGAGGLDTGSLVASTWYYDYAISNGSATSCLGSTSSTNPTMPTGYTYKVRLGADLTDSSSHFMRVQQLGRIAQYVVTAATNTANMPEMASGSAGSVSSPTWVGITLSSFIPPTASRIMASGQVNNGIAMVAPNNGYGASTSTSNPPPFVINNSSTPVEEFSMLLESTSIYWASNASGNAVWCRGWEDNL